LLRGEDSLVVSGLKGDKGERIFYRKVVLACDGRQWRHIALEYPTEAKRSLHRLITNLSKALDRAVADCSGTVVGRN
jgi:hypothetical protein